MKPKPYWNPYVAGVALGLVLLASFVVTGKGLGGSGAFKRMNAAVLHVASPTWAEESIPSSGLGLATVTTPRPSRAAATSLAPGARTTATSAKPASTKERVTRRMRCSPSTLASIFGLPKRFEAPAARRTAAIFSVR